MKRKLWLLSVVVLFGISLSGSNAQAQAVSGDLVPQFNYLPARWLPVQMFQMDPIWNAFGFPECGLNYYTLGGPKDGSTLYWERFNPNSPTYQVFMGTYVVNHFQFAAEWDKPRLKPADIAQSVQRVINLNIADYFAWNSAYGAPTNTAVVPGSLKVLKGDNGWFNIFVLVNTYSDLGADYPWFPWVPPYTLYQDLVEPYQPVTLEVWKGSNTIKLMKTCWFFTAMQSTTPYTTARPGTRRSQRFLKSAR
jgi:hypothetical protein